MGRKLGQHFLRSHSHLKRIAGAVCPEPDTLIIEIGPGKGALTAHLLERGAHVVGIEIDAALANHLASRFAGNPNFTLVQTDVLAADFTRWGPAVVAGNLPYYITSPILSKIFAMGTLCPRAVLLVQAEVAERLTAQPGTRQYGYLSVQTQLYARPEVLFAVPAAAFQPPPKVRSAVVRLAMHASPAASQPVEFLSFVGECFRQKRKTLRNNLKPVYGASIADSLPEAGLRAEQLSLEQFLDLYRRVTGTRP